MTPPKSRTDSSALMNTLVQSIDQEFYSFAYPDLPPDTVAVEHYPTKGWREGRDPNPWFSTHAYLAEYPDLAETGIVPLFHYLQQGSDEGKIAKPSAHAAAYHARDILVGAMPDVAPQSDLDLAREWSAVREEFDPNYYLTVYPDVAQAGLDPLLHFLNQGWREGRDPNAWFSIKRYIEANGDIVASGINPFVHYLLAGRAEGRALKLDLGFRQEILANETTLEERLAQVPDIPTWRIGTANQLRRAIACAERSSGKKLHVSISHDDFTLNLGGLQFCLRREASGFAELGFDHLHFFPARPLLLTDHENVDPVVGVLFNGAFAGEFKANTITEVMRSEIGAAQLFPEKSLAIHSLLGHNAKSITKILKAIDLEKGYFWVHDFASICAGHNLLRNDVEFCGAPSADSPACNLCLYGERRRIQVADHEHVFRELELTVVAPAKKTLDTWCCATTLPARATLVKPHCVMMPKSQKMPTVASSGARTPMRVAFLGFPHVHKGWPVFRELALSFRDDDRYEFYHLGKGAQPGLPITFVEVEVGENLPNAMVAAVEEFQIDAALIWSICPETFCFTAHEAIAGGAVVITTTQSGNLTQLVEEMRKGVTIRDEDQLRQQFEAGMICALARTKRAVDTFSLKYSKLTADFVGADLT